MLNTISLINSKNYSSLDTSSESSSSSLSKRTIAQLKALGLDPSDYTSEAEALSAIAAATANQTQRPAVNNVNLETVQKDAKALALKLGVEVGNKDELTDIFEKISSKIDELKASAGRDATKMAEAQSYESEYSTLYNEYLQAFCARNMVGSTLLGKYNKATLVGA